MSTVSRAGTKSSEPWRCSITWASRPITTRPCREFGSHGPFETGVGMKVSLCSGEERLILSWRVTMTDSARNQGHARRDPIHSARNGHVRSRHGGRLAPRQLRRKVASGAINCDSAHTAAPRTSGLASSSSARPRAPATHRPELPIAISTLRMKRSRPMRLTGDLENSARNAASSSRASSASDGARNSARAASLASRPVCANLFHGHTARQSSQP